MDFSLNDEQRMLHNSVTRLVENSYSFEQRREIDTSKDGFSRTHWAHFTDLGLLAIPFSEAEGGLGGSAIETAIVMRAFGRGLVLEPYFSTVVLAGGLVKHGGSAEQKGNFIPDIIAGTSICAFAYVEEGARYNLANVELSARKEGNSLVLNGEKLSVYAGPVADWIFLTVRTAGSRLDEKGITLVRVPAAAQGLSRRDYRSIDGARASDVRFDNVRVGSEDVIGAEDDALPIVRRVAEEATAALCAEAVGAIEALNEATVDYMKQRRAFGQTLSKFQVIQHRLVDMKIAEEQATALMIEANLAVGETGCAPVISAAKAKIGKEARTVAQGAVQLHGGIGITDELNVGHYMKRLMAIEALFGDTAHHISLFAEARDADVCQSEVRTDTR